LCGWCLVLWAVGMGNEGADAGGVVVDVVTVAVGVVGLEVA
jgi:hypothetical protein